MLYAFLQDNLQKDAPVNTDDLSSYQGMVDFTHESVKHSLGEYMDEIAFTNGLELLWALLKCEYVGIYHQMSQKHLFRYVNESAGCHNIREPDTIDQMKALVRGLPPTIGSGTLP